MTQINAAGKYYNICKEIKLQSYINKAKSYLKVQQKNSTGTTYYICIQITFKLIWRLY